MPVIVGLLVANKNDSKYQNPENQSDSRRINFRKKNMAKCFFLDGLSTEFVLYIDKNIVYAVQVWQKQKSLLPVKSTSINTRKNKLRNKITKILLDLPQEFGLNILLNCFIFTQVVTDPQFALSLCSRLVIAYYSISNNPAYNSQGKQRRKKKYLS